MTERSKNLFLLLMGMLNTRLMQCDIKVELHNDNISYDDWTESYNNFYKNHLNSYIQNLENE